MDAKCSHDLLELSTELPTSEKGWYSEKITDPSLKPLVKKMEEDLKSEKLTGAMFIKEFLRQRIAPLQDHSRPLWKLGGVDDKIRLRQDALLEEELSKVSLYLTGNDPSSPPEEWLLLYGRVDGEEVAAAMPVFDEFEPVQTGPPPPHTSTGRPCSPLPTCGASAIVLLLPACLPSPTPAPNLPPADDPPPSAGVLPSPSAVRLPPCLSPVRRLTRRPAHQCTTTSTPPWPAAEIQG